MRGWLRGEACVAIGILKEYKWPLDRKHKITASLVVGGVVVGFMATFFLFLFDEAISSEQNRTIIALNKQLAPRHLTVSEIQYVESKVSPFQGTPYDIAVVASEPIAFVRELFSALLASHWNFQQYWDFPTFYLAPLGSLGTLGGVEDIEILYSADSASKYGAPANALAEALNAANLPTRVFPVTWGGTKTPPDIIHIEIGFKSSEQFSAPTKR